MFGEWGGADVYMCNRLMHIQDRYVHIVSNRFLYMGQSQHWQVLLYISQHRQVSLYISQHRQVSLYISQHRQVSLYITQHRQVSLYISQHRQVLLYISQHRQVSRNRLRIGGLKKYPLTKKGLGN
jgi:hypothetical protein